jgi:hypothetical protein
MSLPSVFVGSSREGLEVARALHILSDVSEVEVWDEGVFGLSAGILESLMQALSRFDFAVIVLTPDDVTVSRGVELNSTRDNVLIELGLFIGGLGRERTFMLYCTDGKVKIPSDLAGITFATFAMPDDPDKLIAAVGLACMKIRNVIRKLGKKEELQRLTQAVETQERRLNEQQEFINNLVKYSLSASIFRHLCGIAILREYKYSNDDSTRREMYFLRDNGFIKPRSGGFLDFNQSLHGRNLVEVAEPTPIGKNCIKLRKEEIPENMLADKPNLDEAKFAEICAVP